MIVRELSLNWFLVATGSYERILMPCHDQIHLNQLAKLMDANISIFKETYVVFKETYEAGRWWRKLLIPALGRQRQADF